MNLDYPLTRKIEAHATLDYRQFRIRLSGVLIGGGTFVVKFERIKIRNVDIERFNAGINHFTSRQPYPEW